MRIPTIRKKSHETFYIIVISRIALSSYKKYVRIYAWSNESEKKMKRGKQKANMMGEGNSKSTEEKGVGDIKKIS